MIFKGLVNCNLGFIISAHIVDQPEPDEHKLETDSVSTPVTNENGNLKFHLFGN